MTTVSTVNGYNEVYTEWKVDLPPAVCVITSLFWIIFQRGNTWPCHFIVVSSSSIHRLHWHLQAFLTNSLKSSIEMIHRLGSNCGMIRTCELATWIMHRVAGVSLIMKPITNYYTFVIHPWAPKSYWPGHNTRIVIVANSRYNIQTMRCSHLHTLA